MDGTQAQNIADMVARHRSATGDRNGSRTMPERRPRGERNGSAKLTEADVLSIRERFTGKRGEIIGFAREYGVSDGTVHGIVKRRTWVGVEPPHRQDSSTAS